MTDRIVHGLTADGGEIVRYDRAGKWYVEWRDGVRTDIHRKPRQQVSASKAAALATEPDARAFVGRPGGGRFDHIVTARQGAAVPGEENER